MRKVIREKRGDVDVVIAFDDAGVLEGEFFSVGRNIKWIRQRWPDGGYHETYFVNGKVVSGAAYEKARSGFPGMPCSNAELDIYGNSLAVSGVRSGGEPFEPVPSRDGKLGALAAGGTNVSDLLRKRRVVFVGMDKAEAREFFERLMDAGVVSLSAIGLQKDVDGRLIVSEFIAELPEHPSSRKDVIDMIANVSRAGGFDSVVDVGQRYEIIRFE